MNIILALFILDTYYQRRRCLKVLDKWSECLVVEIKFTRLSFGLVFYILGMMLVLAGFFYYGLVDKLLVSLYGLLVLSLPFSLQAITCEGLIKNNALVAWSDIRISQWGDKVIFRVLGQEDWTFKKASLETLGIRSEEDILSYIQEETLTRQLLVGL